MKIHLLDLDSGNTLQGTYRNVEDARDAAERDGYYVVSVFRDIGIVSVSRSSRALRRIRRR